MDCANGPTFLAMVSVLWMTIMSLRFGIARACPVNCTCTLVEILCDSLSEVPQDISNKSHVQKLVIKNHGITVLRKGDLEGFLRLQTLEIANGSLQTLEPGSLDDVNETIVEVNLSHNQIKDLPPGVFVNVNTMRGLNLKFNELRTIRTATFVNLVRLTTLNLGWNNLQSLENDSFAGLQDLNTLYLVFNSFKNVPLVALSDLRNLTDLFMTGNDVTQVSSQLNVKLPSLEVFELDSNRRLTIDEPFPAISNNLLELNLGFSGIRTIENNNGSLWKNLRTLKRLILNGIHVDHLFSGMFNGLDGLDTLLLMSMHDLKSIGPDAFHGLDSVRVVDLSNSELLTIIDESAFMSAVNLTHLYLRNCSLTFIPAKLVPWDSMTSVNVTNNPLHCDCNAGWMLDEVVFGNNTDVMNEIQNMKCASPLTLRGMRIRDLNQGDLTCTADQHSKFAVVVIVVVFCAALVVVIVLIYKRRNKIYMWCYQYFQYRRYKNDMVFTVNRDSSIAELEDTIETRPLANMSSMRLETQPL